MTKTEKLKQFLANPPSEFASLKPKERKAIAAAHSGMTSGSLTVWLSRQDEETRKKFGMGAPAPRKRAGRKAPAARARTTRKAAPRAKKEVNGTPRSPETTRDVARAIDKLDLDALLLISQQVRRRIEQKLDRARKELAQY